MPSVGAAMSTSRSGGEPPFLAFLAILALVWLMAWAIILGRHYLL
jgi:hypothetical protein